MKPLISLVFLLFLSCSGIGLIEDYVPPPTLRITTTIEKAPVGASFELNAFYFNNIGDRVEDASIQCTSSNPEIIFIETTGKATTKMEGTAQLIAQTVSEKGTRGLFISSLYAQLGLFKKVNLIAYIPFLVKNCQFTQVSKLMGKFMNRGKNTTVLVT